ncbi:MULTISPECIES: SMC-Scp complex subunit ScpB [unclassified Schlesneria]|uniref:SMC-Scp complex subunit ScpB n=1 Tax=unclassified Schlesneria TaxID=2762017 RepID=UPI002EDD85E7
MTSSFSDDQPDLSDDESDFDPYDDDLQEDDELLSDPVDDWGGGELEAAYLKALSALEASEIEFAPPVPESSTLEELQEGLDDAAEEVEASKAPVLNAGHAPAAAGEPDELLEPIPDGGIADESPEPLAKSDAVPAPEFRPVPRQIIEACLFVGGTSLTASRLASVLRGDFRSDYVDREIDELNRLYAAEGRPYEIRLGEGGYRLTLREEFERIRHKVYGLGPKEVRLSQEALEVLAVIAYHQPMTQARIEELGKPGRGAVVRQLVRRELVAVVRDPQNPKEVHYVTTPRFLSLFGIRNLDELPRPEQVSYK